MSDSNLRLRSYLRLHLADGVGALTVRRLIDAFGEVGAVPRDERRLQQVEGIGPKTAAAIVSVTDDDVDEELAIAAEAGAAMLCPDDEGYPPALKNIHDPPAVLYVLGRLEPADAVALAVVGSRRCTHYGLEQAERFGGLLGRAGYTVVSGGARGIDTAAHRGCLDAGGRTIAVMGCGLRKLYPPENEKLFRRIVADGRGAILSELPMRTAVLPGNFPTRNRIIAGLGLGVLVVEAARRSGSLITARLAIEQGRDVLAVPGRVDSPFSQGTNQLIADGAAALVQDLDDILDRTGRVGEQLREDGAAEPPPRAINVGDDERAVLAALAGGELPADELVRRTGLPPAKVTAAMTMLAIKGLVSSRPGGLFAAKA